MPMLANELSSINDLSVCSYCSRHLHKHTQHPWNDFAEYEVLAHYRSPMYSHLNHATFSTKDRINWLSYLTCSQRVAPCPIIAHPGLAVQ